MLAAELEAEPMGELLPLDASVDEELEELPPVPSVPPFSTAPLVAEAPAAIDAFVSEPTEPLPASVSSPSPETLPLHAMVAARLAMLTC